MFIGSLVVRADAGSFFIFTFGDERFATGAVPTFIIGGIDVGLELFPDSLATAGVVGIGSADKVGRRGAEARDEVTEGVGVRLYVLFEGDVEGVGFFPDFITMFVGAGLEADGGTVFGEVAIINIGQEIVESVAGVRSAVNVRDGGSEIERLVFIERRGHCLLVPGLGLLRDESDGDDKKNDNDGGNDQKHPHRV